MVSSNIMIFIFYRRKLNRCLYCVKIKRKCVEVLQLLKHPRSLLILYFDSEITNKKTLIEDFKSESSSFPKSGVTDYFDSLETNKIFIASVKADDGSFCNPLLKSFLKMFFKNYLHRFWDRLSFVHAALLCYREVTSSFLPFRPYRKTLNLSGIGLKEKKKNQLDNTGN